MTSEVKSALNDSNVAIQIAIGDPAPKLVPQNPGSGIVKDGVHYAETKRYVLKKAHLAMDDIRIFDTEGNLVANSHHPGKNPYDALDPLGLANTVRHPVLNAISRESLAPKSIIDHLDKSFTGAA
eukprot:IDg19029t1